MATKKSSNQGAKSEINVELICISGSNERFVKAGFILVKVETSLCCLYFWTFVCGPVTLTGSIPASQG